MKGKLCLVIMGCLVLLAPTRGRSRAGGRAAKAFLPAEEADVSFLKKIIPRSDLLLALNGSSLFHFCQPVPVKDVN
jgi:hypothetical protein